MPHRRAIASAALMILALSGCGDSTEPAELDGTMHASIVGSSDPWDAEKTLTATMRHGNLVITGVESSTIEIVVTIYDAAVGSFTAVAGDPVPSVVATYGDARTFSYGSVRAGGTASATITELTDSRAVGTFAFMAAPVIPDLQGTPVYRIVNGTFNVRLR